MKNYEAADFPPGTNHEMQFWADFVQTPRFLEGWCGDCITPELQDDVKELIIMELTDLGGHGNVLDVGSGVVSILHGLCTPEELTSTDLLGSIYPDVFDYASHKLQAPLPIAGENLASLGDEKYDIVHCRNAFDHTQNPEEVFNNMMQVLKPGGILIIHGFENEAVAENWQGFHQWNCICRDSFLIVEGRKMMVKFHANRSATSTPIGNGKTWFTWVSRKL